MKNRMIYAMAAVAMMAVGCQKDRNADGMLLLAEGFNNNGSKVLVDSLASTWADGDEVRINDQTAAVSVTTGNASVHLGSGVDAPFYGVYPACIYGSNSGASYTLNLPATYTYETDGTYQKLASPMVGYTDNSTSMTFKHLTAAVTVQVVNYCGFTIQVDSIVVSSDSYKLNGAMNVTLGGGNPVVETEASSDADAKKVTMLFNGSTSLQVFAGDSANVQVPVLPVGGGNKFTVRVVTHKVDQPSVKPIFEKEQVTGGALARANLGYARTIFGGLFSVSSNKKVIISQGNLQYQASTAAWKFSETQYGYIGNDVGNTASLSVYENQTDWIDLFGWGTSGWDNGNTKYQPYCINVTGWSDNNYGPKSGETFYDLTGDYANSDWGVYNVISNGGDGAGRWHLLTNAEWTYLTSYYRGSATVNNTSRAKYTYASVNETHGVIFFPDEFTVPTFIAGSSWGTINSSSDWSTTIFLEDWYLLEAAGCIFLPAAGSRGALGATAMSTSTPNVSSANSYGYYWSSIQYSNSNAYYQRFYSKSAFSTQNASKYQGYSVRLVRDVE